MKDMKIKTQWGGRSAFTLRMPVLAVILLAGLQTTLAQGGNGLPPPHPVMHFTREQLLEMQAAHFRAPQLAAPPVFSTFGGGPTFGGSLSLLADLPYVPAERNQGSCDDCWQWASTGILEIAHQVQNGVSDRLSVQFINSCDTSNICCNVGDIGLFAEFYAAEGFCIPWSNTNAAYDSSAGGTNCIPCGSIATTPQYPIGSIQALAITTTGVGQAQAIANIKSVLNQNKAVEFGLLMATADDWTAFGDFWENETESGLWTNTYCGQTFVEGGGGGHALLCVGYNDDVATNSYWIIVNSWGANAGRPNGLFHLGMNLDYDCSFQTGNGTAYSLLWSTLDVEFSAAVPHVDHFSWDTIPSPQSTNNPFPVTITAQTAVGVVETNFAGTVALSGLEGGAATNTLWADGFASTNLSDWTPEFVWPDVYDVFVTTKAAAPGSVSSLFMYGGDFIPCDGISHVLDNLTPNFISFYVATGATNEDAAYFVVGDAKYGTNSVAFFLMGDDGTMGLYDGTQWHGTPYLADQWYKISLVLDWTALTISYYVDGALVESGIPFRNPAISALTLLNLYNFSPAESWYDAIEFLESGTSYVPISPVNSGAFVNGVWSGNLAVLQTASNLVLKADDGNGHSGLSNPFSVSASAAPTPTITVQPTSLNFGSIQVGTSASQNLYVTNDGGGTLTGSATVSSPFSIVSGGSYSLVAGQSQQVVVSYNPTAAGTNDAVVNFTGGGGATVGLTGAAYLVPPPNLYSFTNAGTITINEALPDNTPSAATPYPSSITVAGLSGTLSNVSVTLCGFSHTYPHDVAVLLVGPRGQKVVVMANSGGYGVSDVTYTFNDYAATALTEYPSGPTPSGTYKPSDCGSGIATFPAGAPAGPYQTVLAICNGASPNGVWSLYVQDDYYGDFGSIANGWAVAFNLLTLPQAPVITQQPQPQAVIAGSPATFSLLASNAQSYAWQMNGTNLTDGGRISGSTTPVLTIANTQTNDSGSELSCLVGNANGVVTSADALLTVYPTSTSVLKGWTSSNGVFQFTLTGALMGNYIIYESSDLKSWRELTVVTTTNGSITVSDPSSGLKQRFYRAKAQ
jgi:subtilisin-like proprotein convertase family protein